MDVIRYRFWTWLSFADPGRSQFLGIFMKNKRVLSEKAPKNVQMDDKKNAQPGDDCREVHSNEREDDVCPAVGLGDLPEVCLAVILSCLPPREVARLACMCRSFREASIYDSVWDSFLPPTYILQRVYREYLALDPDAVPSRFSSKREIFDHLCHPLVLANHTRAFWLDRDTGGVCMSIAARPTPVDGGVHVLGGDDERWWAWQQDGNSLFPKVVRLKTICWFEAIGETECSLPPGAYTFTWRLCLHELKNWEAEPVHFTLSKNGVEISECKSFIDTRAAVARRPVEHFRVPTIRTLDAGWTEYDVGEFLVEKGEETCTLKFGMKAIHIGLWKSGIFLDGVVIRPTQTIRPMM